MRRTALLLLLLGVAVAEEGPRIFVHAPAEDLLALFPKEGAGYLISIDEYGAMLRKARENEARLRERPPVGARIVRGALSARVDGDALRLEGEYVAVAAAEGASEVGFPVEGLAVESVECEGAAFAGDSVRFPAPGSYAIRARFSARLSRDGEIRRAEFTLPPAAAQTVSVALPAEVEGEVGPIVRSFRTDSAGGEVAGHADGRGLFQLWFQPRARARRADALLSASFQTLCEVGEARAITRTKLLLEALRAPVDRVDLGLASGQTVRDLQGKGVRSWRLDGASLEVRFVDPVQGAIELQVESEAPRDGAAALEVPLVRVPAAVRYRGTVGVAAAPEVRINALVATGARRLDEPGAEKVALFEAWSRDARIAATVERVLSTTRAVTQALLYLHEGGKTLRVRFLYRIGRQSLFRLEPRLPAGWILRSLSLDGRPVEHSLEKDGRLTLVFPEGLKPGEHALDAALDTDEVDWVPPEKAAPLDFIGPASGIDEETGHLAVASDPAFRVNAEATAGLLPVGMPDLERAGFPSSGRILYAWRFEAPGWTARLAVERHRPQINAVVTNRLAPSEQLLRVHAAVRLDIRRAGVRELRVALPKGTGSQVDFEGVAIKEKRPPAAEAAGDREVWTIVFQRRVRGAYRLDVRWDRRFEKDAWDAAFEGVSLPDAQERGFLVVDSSPMTSITVDRDGLREADVGELPEPPEGAPLEVLAYAAHPFSLKVSSRRHESREVVQAIALSAHVYGVLTADGRLRCRAEYSIRNNDQPFLSFSLPRGAALLGALVDGKPAKPLVEGRALKLPLPRSRERLEPFAVAIVYDGETAPLRERGEVGIATPALDVDVLETGYTLHLPDGYRVEGHEGDLVPIEAREAKTLLDAVLGIVLWPAKQVAEAAAPRPGAAGPPRKPARSRRSELARKAPEQMEPSDHNEEPAPDTAAAPATPAPPAAEAAEPAEESEFPDEDRKAEEPPGDRTALDEIDRDDEAKEVAKGGEGKTPPPEPAPKPGWTGKRRPEKALLSLDIDFLKPDNLVRLRTLARSGDVTLRYARSSVADRNRFTGVVLGGAFGLLLLFGGVGLRRLLLGTLLLLPALHFAGLSLLPAESSVGAAAGFSALLLLRLAARLPRLVGRLFRRLRKPAAALPAILLLAAAAEAGDEVLVPYDPKDPEKIERVFLDAKTYERLRKLAYPDEAAHATAVLSADYRARVANGEATVSARYEIAKETAAAERLPFLFTGVALLDARLDGKPATLELTKEGACVLIVQGAGRHLFEATLKPRLGDAGGARGFEVPVRPVATAKLTVEHDRPNHRVVAAALGRSEGDTFHLGPVALLSASIAPETETFRAPAAELRADTEAVASVRDGFTGVAARIRYGISGGTAGLFRIRLGKDLVLREVRCPDLAGWEIDGEGVLAVALAKPAANSLAIELVAERPSSREREESFPEIAPLDVQRDAGVLAIDTLPDLKLEILEQSGLLRGREDQAPASLAGADTPGTLHSVYRYAVRPFSLRWRAALEETRVRAETSVELFLARDHARAIARIDAKVERGPGLFSLPVRVPSDWEVTQVAGETLRDHWREGGLLHLELKSRGPGSFAISLRRRVGAGSPVEAPAISVEGAVRESGLLVVGAEDGFEVDAEEASPSLLPEDVSKVRAGIPVARAYRFVAVPWRLVVRAREEAREVEAMAVTRILPLEDHLRVEALVHFYVRRGLVETLQLTVPVGDESAAVVSAPDLRETRSEPLDGARRFTLRLRTPTRGSASAAVTYDLPYGVPIRCVEPLGASRVRRYVAVEKASDGEVKVGELRHLEAGTFEDLPLVPTGTTAQSLARVYVGGDGEVGLSVLVARYGFEEIARAVIHRAAAQVLVDRSGLVRANVSYRVYNRSEQFLRLVLPAGATLYSVLVAGEGVRPLAEGAAILVPLRKVAIGMPSFDVDLLYAYEEARVGERDLGIRLPEVLGIDVRRTTLSLHVPKGFAYSFETSMERVEESDLVASEATDAYQEAKQLWSVAEHGNRWQAQRAIENASALEQETVRLGEKVQTLSEDAEKARLVELQNRALRALRENLVRVQPQQEGTDDETTVGYVQQLETQEGRAVTDWSVNADNFRRASGDDATQLKDFADKNKEAAKQVEETRSRQQQANRPTRPDAPSGGGGGGGGAPGFENGLEADLRARAENLFDAELVADGRADAGRTAAEEDAGLARAPRAAGPATAAKLPLAALGRGRVSIRIDLPKRGEVFHFARLAPTGSVTVRAKEAGGRFRAGALALLLGAGAAFLLFRRRGRREPPLPA